MNQIDEFGLTLLSWAAANDQFLTVESLLERGADVGMYGDGGVTPLMLAANNGHERVLRELITAGAELNQTDQVRM